MSTRNQLSDRAPSTAWVGLAIASLVLLVGAGCGDDGDGSSIFVVGDSTMVQIEALTGAGATLAGCGYTLDAICIIPLESEIPADVELIVASVSVWDTDATVENVAAGYRGYHANLSQHAPVVWIEVPPRFDAVPGDTSYLKTAALNATVAEALGCELVPWSLRVAASDDGIHYAGDGAAEVAERIKALTPEDACPPPES